MWLFPSERQEVFRFHHIDSEVAVDSADCFAALVVIDTSHDLFRNPHELSLQQLSPLLQRSGAAHPLASFYSI